MHERPESESFNNGPVVLSSTTRLRRVTDEMTLSGVADSIEAGSVMRSEDCRAFLRQTESKDFIYLAKSGLTTKKNFTARVRSGREISFQSFVASLTLP